MRLNTSGRIAGLCLVGLLLAQGASAELRRVEAVGIYGIKESMRTRVIPKDEAISLANWEGISRVALELIGESSGFTDLGEAHVDRDVGDIKRLLDPRFQSILILFGYSLILLMSRKC